MSTAGLGPSRTPTVGNDPRLAARRAFYSILGGDRIVSDEVRAEPAFFRDLNLDQLVAAATEGRDEYDLAPFYSAPLRDPVIVRYRHEALRDLQTEAVTRAVRGFARRMHEMRERLALAGKLPAHQQQRWFLAAVETYCDAVRSLREDLFDLPLRSDGFRGLREHVGDYVASTAFVELARDTEQRVRELGGVRYTIEHNGLRVTVDRYQGELDLTSQIETTFAKFRHGDVKDYRVRFPGHDVLDHVEARILDLVADLHPETFGRLAGYCAEHREFVDEKLSRFDREVQFYLSYLEYIEPLRASGLPFCYPVVSERAQAVFGLDSFDLALAAKLVADDREVVSNDFEISAPERILVVTGPNQGGKTTFARMVGQLHHLGSLGLPVPGVKARLHLPDRIFTHFEREEDLTTLRGKFEDELHRIHAILEMATRNSVVIMNESFTATTLRDAVLVGTAVLRKLIDRGPICVCVTFVDELSELGEETASMMSTVASNDPTARTFKVVRRRADGLAYAVALADRHGLSYRALKRRVAR